MDCACGDGGVTAARRKDHGVPEEACHRGHLPEFGRDPFHSCQRARGHARARARVREAEAKPYVFRIALNLASNRLRSKKLWQWAGLDGLLGRGETDGKLLADEREQKAGVGVECGK